MRLYEIGTVYREAIECLERLDTEELGEVMTSDGEVLEGAEARDHLRDALDAIEGDLVSKIDACAAIAIELDAEADAYATEAARLKKRAESTKAKRDRIREYVLATMVVAGIAKSKGPRFQVSVSAPAKQVAVFDLAAIPDPFRRVIPERYEADKVAIKRAIQSGTEVPGASLIEGARSLRIS